MLEFLKAEHLTKKGTNTHSLYIISVSFWGDQSLLSHSMYSIIGLAVTQNSTTRAKVETILEGNIG